MKLRELVNKIDNDTPLFIIWGPNAEDIFKREHDPDVIPENLLKMEVAIVFNEFNSLHIHVKRNSRKGSFRELLNCLHDYEYIDVYVVNRDGAKERVYSGRVALCTNYKYDNYLVKRISPHRAEWGDKTEIVIEPCEEDALETLIQAVADCQNAMDGLVYALLLDKSAIQQKIKEADERAKRLYEGSL